MKKSASLSCQPCSVVNYVMIVLLTASTVAALIGVWHAHFPSAGMVFGSTSGSLSLLALAVNLLFWKKAFAGCCGCDVK